MANEELNTKDIAVEKVPVNVPDIFNGPIAATTIKMSIPILISQTMVFLYIITDTFFISLIDRESTALLSGVGLVFPIFLIFFNLGTSLFLGTSSVTARGIGNQDENILKKTGDSGFLLSLIIGALTIILSVLFGDQLIHSLAGSQLSSEAIQYALDYFYYLLPYLVLLLVFNTIGGVLQGEGLSKEYGGALVLSIILNILLNPLFIFTFDLGVKGSGIASSVAIGVALVIFVFIFAKKKTKAVVSWNVFNVNKKIIVEILRIGIPASIGLFLINFATMILNNIVGSISQAAMSAWVLVGRIDQLFLIPAYAIGLTSIPMIGQNFGRGNMKRSNQIFRTNLLISLAISLFLAIIYFVLANLIVSLFSTVPEVISTGVSQIRWLAFTSVGVAIITVIGCCFQATGKVIPNLVNDSIRVVIISIPMFLSFFQIKVDEMSTIFWCVGLGNVIALIIAVIWGGSYFRKLQDKEYSLNSVI